MIITKTIYKEPSRKEMEWIYNISINAHKLVIGLYISVFQISQTTIGVNYTVDINTENQESLCTLSHVDTEDDIVDTLIEQQRIILSSNTINDNWYKLSSKERDTILNFARKTVQYRLLYFYANSFGI